MVRPQFRLETKEVAWNWVKDISPALLVLIFSLFFQLYLVSELYNENWRIVYRVFLRFFRYTLFLCLPLILLNQTYTWILKRKNRTLIQVDSTGELKVDWIKHWLFRPFQGVGIAFLFATKLLAVIQIVSGPSSNSSIPFTPGHFNYVRILVSTGITIGISLLLSTLWTFDDLGVRYHNRKDQELKMIGKYIGTLMPAIFGLYGVFSLYAQTPGESALVHVFRIIIALYPSLVVFAVVHTYFIRRRMEYFSGKAPLVKGGVWRQEA